MTAARLAFLQEYHISEQPNYVVDFLVRHRGQMPLFNDVPDPVEVCRVQAINRTIVERDKNGKEVAAVSLTLTKARPPSGKYHFADSEYGKSLGELESETIINKFRRTDYEGGEQNPTVYLFSTFGGRVVERRRFQGGKLQEAIELGKYRKGTQSAEIVKPIQTKDGQTIYIAFHYSEWGRSSSDFGTTIKGAKDQPFLPYIQASFGSHKGTDATVGPEDWLIDIRSARHTRGQAELKKQFKDAGITGSNQRIWMTNPSDREPSKIAVRDDTFILTFDDDLLCDEVEFPKVLAFEDMFREWQERIAS